MVGQISRHEADCQYQPRKKVQCPVCKKWKPQNTSHSPGECQLRAYQRKPRTTFGDVEFGSKRDLWEPPDVYEALCEISNSGGIMPWLPLRYCNGTPPTKLPRKMHQELKTRSNEITKQCSDKDK